VRRFNAAIQNTYHRTPSHIRRLARQAGALPENQYHFRLSFRPPYDWHAMLAFLAPRATPGVEVVESGCYRRTISVNGEHGWFESALDERNAALTVRIQFPNPCLLFFIVERIRAMFDLNGDSVEIARCLGSDPVLAKPVKAAPGLRVPGSWNGFELATRAILGQQISVKGATTLSGRVATTFGEAISAPGGMTHLFPPAEVLAEADLRRAGILSSRAETIRVLARAVCEGRINFEGIVNSVDFLARLREIRGIGEWTAQYIAMRALGEPDAFPAGDLGLVRASGAALSRELERRAEAWRPWRAYAAMYLWKSLADNSARKVQPARSTREKLPKQRTIDTPFVPEVAEVRLQNVR
jgi:AraC family transcriptional regulator of adaptative response / DNA-3-methyladenine glycosylase II